MTMVNVGDRIAVAAAKGAPARHGTVVEQVGRMLVVDWDDGHRSGFIPGPGAVSVQRRARDAAPSARGARRRPAASASSGRRRQAGR
jgi:hypothetical protein